MMVGGHERESYAGRRQNDCYPTPPFVTYALSRVESLPRVILEPACGRGWMSRELLRLGHEVLSHDIHIYDDPLIKNIVPIDYLNCVSMAPHVEGVVTNPPYANDLAQKFIEKTLEHYEYGAFLCRLTFAESQRRYKLFSERPPARVWAFSQRFSCDESRFDSDPLGGMVAYAWWVWDHTYLKPQDCIQTSMRWIDTRKMYDEWRQDAARKPY